MMKTAEHTNRPLTEEEKAFASEHHDLIYRYMRIHKLDFEEWYDILIIPYLQAVKKYHQYEKLKSLMFEQVFFRTLDSARSNYHRDMNRQKRKPAGGIYSYDAVLDDDNNTFEAFIVDAYMNVERQVILKELYKEFYGRCIEKRSEYETDIRKDELDMLLEGYTRKQILKATLNKYGGNNEDGMYSRALGKDVEKFRKIFKQVFGI